MAAAPAGGTFFLSIHCCKCGGPPKIICGSCGMFVYCSSRCGIRHWEAGHKRECIQTYTLNLVPTGPSTTTSNKRECTQTNLSVPTDGSTIVPNKGECKKTNLSVPTGGSTIFLNKIPFPYKDLVQIYNSEEVQLYNSEEKGGRPFGLKNCGTSCYASVVFQCLAYTRPLYAYLLRGGHPRKCSNCFLCEFQIVMKRANRGKKPVYPRQILYRLFGSDYADRQQDAHKFMSHTHRRNRSLEGTLKFISDLPASRALSSPSSPVVRALSLFTRRSSHMLYRSLSSNTQASVDSRLISGVSRSDIGLWKRWP